MFFRVSSVVVAGIIVLATLAACGTTNKYYLVPGQPTSEGRELVVVPGNGGGGNSGQVVYPPYPPMYPPMQQGPAQTHLQK